VRKKLPVGHGDEVEIEETEWKKRGRRRDKDASVKT